MKLSNVKDIPEFKNSYVHIRDEEELLQKINKIIEDGHENLQIVTDFDHTLTKHFTDNGEAVLTSFGMFRECPSIPQYYKDEDNRLASIYKPIERDPHMSIEKKTEHMVEWYKAAHEQLRGVTFPKEELMDIAHTVVKCFRKGVEDMIQWSQQHKVPVLVFSAGLGDAVVAAMRAANFWLPNVKAISNFLAVGEDDKITGMQGEIIHTLNKNEAAIKDTEHFALVRARGNVLLLGDNVGDAAMADGMDHCRVVVKVGLLGHHVPASLPRYLATFDVVLVGDPPLDVVNAILKLIL